MPKNPTLCLDCGKATAGGIRCKLCHGAFIAQKALDETAATDSTILGLVKDGLTVRQIAGQLGVSAARAHQKIQIARAREVKRSARA
jgi:hypothetical protein